MKVAPRAYRGFDIKVYDWLVIDEVAYRVHKVERIYTNGVRVHLSNGEYKTYNDNDCVTYLDRA